VRFQPGAHALADLGFRVVRNGLEAGDGLGAKRDVPAVCADRRISAAKRMDGAERQRRQVGRDIENVRAVRRAARDFQDLMRTTIDELDRRRRFSDGVGPVEMRDAA